MKRTYKVIFLIALVMFTTLIGFGYQYSYRYAQKQQEDTSAVTSVPQSVSAQGETDTVQNKGYYLSHLHGFVVVYYADRHTIYEVTDIELMTLPAEIQGEITEGKHVRDLKEIYGFLENYSS